MSIMLAAKILNLLQRPCLLCSFVPPPHTIKRLHIAKVEKNAVAVPALKDVYTFLLNSTYNNDDNILYYQY